jgi:DNA-binding transcriptional MocR family regulator
MASFHDVRVGIYTAIVQTGRAPSAEELALVLGLGRSTIADAYRALADARVIVLRAGTLEIVWAPPFSTVPTAFRATAGSRSWYAPCAWDVFGIPAALKSDAVVDARCAWSAEPIDCGISNGRAYGEGVIHLVVPAAHFWDDIAYT